MQVALQPHGHVTNIICLYLTASHGHIFAWYFTWSNPLPFWVKALCLRVGLLTCRLHPHRQSHCGFQQLTAMAKCIQWSLKCLAMVHFESDVISGRTSWQKQRRSLRICTGQLSGNWQNKAASSCSRLALRRRLPWVSSRTNQRAKR